MTEDEEKSQVLFSQHQAIHRLNYVLSLPMNEIERNLMPVTIRNRTVNVIQGNIPVYCKIFIGDRSGASVKLNIKLASEVQNERNAAVSS